MSFTSVLKSIENFFTKTVAVVQPLEPIISVIPGGVIFNTIFNSIATIEGAFAGITGLGAAKKAAVTAIVNSTPGISVASDTLSTTIDEVVTGLNALQTAQNKVS